MYGKSNRGHFIPSILLAPSKVPGGGVAVVGTIFELEGGAADLQT